MSISQPSNASFGSPHARVRTFSTVETAVAALTALGVLLVLLVPAARGHSLWLGWGPLWLVGMPLAAWWALHGFRLTWLKHMHRIGRGKPRQALRRR